MGASVATAGASVATGASVAAAVASSTTAGASVAAPPPQAASKMLANTTSENKTERFFFTFLLQRKIGGLDFSFRNQGSRVFQRTSLLNATEIILLLQTKYTTSSV
jgi:hypothetical protein